MHASQAARGWRRDFADEGDAAGGDEVTLEPPHLAVPEPESGVSGRASYRSRPVGA